MAGAAVFAVVALLGMIAVFGWIAYVSNGIRREDHALGALAGLDRSCRHARRATGAHWV